MFKHNNQVSPRTKFKRAIAFVTAFQILSFALLPSASIVAAEASSKLVAQGETTTTTKSTKSAAASPTKESLGLVAESAILMEASTGQIIVNINSEVALPPASMTKMMTEYIVMEKVKNGELAWEDNVSTKKNAALTQGSRVFLAENDTHTVRDLYIAMAIASANDAAVALAEHIAGTEQDFVKLMNDTAKRLDMKTAYFVNATGLEQRDMPEEFRPGGEHETVMSAIDVAKLVRAIVQDHPEFSQFTTIQKKKFRERDKTEMDNLNWMLEANKNVTNFKRYAYPGVDGMKTGFTDAAQYTFAGTAKRDNMRLITVVMGTKSKEARFTETAKLMDYGFNNLEVKQAVASKQVVPDKEVAPIKKGVSTDVRAVTEKDVSFVVDKGAAFDEKTLTNEVKLIPEDQLVAPIKNGQKVGTVTYTFKGKTGEQKQTVNLIASEDVEKGSWWRLFFRAIKNFFVDLFKSIGDLF
ncbi:D-alanyl-D-alanine carboxypeptidase [Paenibacillus sp. ACRRX]|uniref:D-alanyl-D-alanine carboxypeptidase family protein n=1 Tax=Paenibacillus sp. ACRRX TaxID=2918206 RepID=UPI001EF47581|nr:D-alanyl-D-alanine carboxypeptidase [Paenibacillus sp. ACRRX]